jgi:hypothetical protein
MLVAVPLTSKAVPEDEGSGGDLTTEDVSPIFELTVPNVLVDFNFLPQGPTTLEAIQSQFPQSCITGLAFITRAGTGTYDFQTGGGRALAPNPDGSGDLLIVDPGGSFGNADSLIINLAIEVTQFGFEIGDWAGPFNAVLSRGGLVVGMISVSTVGDNRTHNFESTDPFDQIELTALPDNPEANWVVPSLRSPICEFERPIPTLSEWGFIVMAGILGIAALLVIRRRRIAA